MTPLNRSVPASTLNCPEHPGAEIKIRRCEYRPEHAAHVYVHQMVCSGDDRHRECWWCPGQEG